jgi:1-acyl-sn-glycerol-3-phosphate acyltransferase
MNAPTHINRDAPRSYWAVKGWAWLAVSVFYKRIEIIGSENLDAHGPVIIAANHSNALADVAVILGKLPGLPRFLAAGSWWKVAPARLLFRMAGALPVHRRRDGGGADQNVSAFEACHAALADGAHIVIFPEGETHLEPKLLPLKTGAARIALGAAHDARVKGITIVPVGLVYEDRGRFRSHVALQVGQPIHVDEWTDRYHVDPTAAVRDATELLTARLAAVSVNHDSSDDATVIERAAAFTIYAGGDGEGDAQFGRRNAMRHALASAIARTGGPASPEYRTLAAAVHAHIRDLERLGMGHADAAGGLMPSADRRNLRIELAMLTPLAALGAVHNAPVALGVKLMSRRVKHEVWQATTKGIGATLLCPVVWAFDFALLNRRFGRRRALGITVVGAFGGLAWIAWHERWTRSRTRTWLERNTDEALGTARQSREAVREQVTALVGAPASSRAASRAT